MMNRIFNRIGSQAKTWANKLSAKLNKAFKTAKFGPGKGVAFVAICLCVVLFVGVSIAWFTSQINLTGGEFSTGTIDFLAYGYDVNGTLITTIYPEGKIPADDTTANSPLFSDSDMQAGSVSTAYIAIENSGSLDMEYKLSFSVSAHQGETSEDMVYLGGYWYSLVDITANVTDGNIAAYAAANKALPCNTTNCANDVHTCKENTTGHNLSTISQYSGGGIINANSGVKHYYRLDYGVRKDATPTDYAGRKFAVNANVFTSQVGTIQNPDGGYGVTRYVTNVETLETAIDQALPGDTILLMNDVTYNGDLIIKKCINFEAGGKTLTVNGNMIYDFVSTLPLKINVQGKGTIKVLANGAVGGNFTISAPQSQVELIGGNTAGDLFVGRYFTVDATNALESGGCIFSDIVIMDGEGKTAKAVYVRSNTKITVSTGVTLERIEAAVQATNIEIQNAGQINQILLSSMFQTTQVDAPQIYIHNYNRITNITLPLWSVPFVKGEDGTYSGNTRIVVSAGGVIDSLIGSERFDESHIEDEGADLYVEQIGSGVDTGLRVYYRNLPDVINTTLEQLITDYFTNKGLSGVKLTDAIEAIDTLEVICRGDKRLAAADFTFMNSKLKGLANLDLSQSVVEGNALPESAFTGKTSLTKLELPKNLTTINRYALSGTGIKTITIPATVTNIKQYGLRYIRYVYMQSYEPCTISTSDISGKTYFFVPESVLSVYRTSWSDIDENIYSMAQLADDGATHVRKLGDGTYEIVHYLGTDTALVVGKDVSLNGTELTITQVGEYAYYHLSQAFELSFGVTVESISSYAFSETNVSGEIDFNQVKKVGDYAFYKCNQLNVIPENNVIREIGTYAFNNCVRLYKVVLPSIETVNGYAFGYNYSLVSISFGENLTTLARNQFEYGTSLREVTIKAPIYDNVSIANFYSNMPAAVRSALRVYVPASAYADYYSYFTYNLCEDGEKVNAHSIDVYYNSVVIGTVDIGQFRVRDLGNGTVSISGCNVFASDVADSAFWNGFIFVPETINGSNVVRIGPSAYRSVSFAAVTMAQDAATNPWGNCTAIIPATVTEIGAYAFYNTDVTLTSLPNVQTVGNNAFSGCTKLYTINAPELLSVDADAFSGIKTLYQFKAEKLNTIGNNTFNGCSNLLRLYVPSLNALKASWLADTTNLRELWVSTGSAVSYSTIPSYDINNKMLVFTHEQSTTRKSCVADSAIPANVIAEYTIKDESGNTLCVLEDVAEYWVLAGDDGATILNYAQFQPTTPYTIPDAVQAVIDGSTIQLKVTTLGFASFTGVDFSGNDVKFGANITTLLNRAFYKNTTMGGTLNLNGVTTIGQYCFYATPVTRVVAPHLTTLSSTYAFAECTLLKSVSMPKLTQLTGNTFRLCSNLESIYLEDITSFASNAFYQDYKLTNITINRVVDAVPTWATYSGSSYKFAFYVPYQSLALYQASSSYNKYNIYALDTVLINDDGMYSLVDENGSWKIVSFVLGTDVTTLTLPESHEGKNITAIAAGAFNGCQNITAITLPSGYSYYQYGTFSGLTALQAVNVATGSAYFQGINGVLFSANGEELVYYPTNNPASAYTVPSGTKIIQSYAFENAVFLNTITLADSVTVIGYQAFSGIGLQTITFNSAPPPLMIGTDMFDVSVTDFGIRVPVGALDTYKTASAFIKYQQYISEQ